MGGRPIRQCRAGNVPVCVGNQEAGRAMDSFAKFVLALLGLVFYQVFSGWYPSATSVALAASAFSAGGAVVGVIVLVLAPASKTADEQRRATQHERQRQADDARLQRVRA